jgi:hypothetical protein
VPPFPRLRIEALDDLARQLRRAPRAQVLERLERVEALAEEIDPAINYPQDWVVFRITGQRPAIDDPPMFVGEALLGDISGLVERLSDAANLSLDQLEAGAWLDAAAVCERWEISRRTLERWRRLGLIARRVRGPNGKARLAFPLAAVERFERRRSGLLGGAAAYSRIARPLEERMLRRAAAYARLGCSLNQAAVRISERYGRGLETVRQLIRRRESVRALFDDRGPPGEHERRLIERAWWLAIEPREVARRLKRSTASVLRVANDARAARLRAVLLGADAPAGEGVPAEQAERILATAPVVSGLGGPSETDLLAFVRSARSGEVPLGVVEKARARAYPVLLARARAGAAALPASGVSGADVDTIETDLRWAVRLKTELVRSQVPLLVRTLEAAVARSLEEVRTALLIELIRAGLAAIGEAVEAFDPDKGGRLAAPAGMAVQRAAARVLRESAPEPRAGGRAAPRLAAGVAIADWTRSVALWQVWEGRAWLEPSLRVRRGLAGLEPGLALVLELRYGWGPAPVTTAEAARRLGVPLMRLAVMERRAVRLARRAAV